MNLITQIADKNNINKKEILACEKFFKNNKQSFKSLEKLDKRKSNAQYRNMIKAYFSYNDIVNKFCKTNKLKNAVKAEKEKVLKESFSEYIDDYLRGFEYGYKSLNKTIENIIKDNVDNRISEYVPSYHSHQEGKLIFLKVPGEDTNRYFGLELESKGDLENACMIEKYKDLFSPEEDGSLSQEGFELVSEPMTLKFLYKNKSKIDNMLKILKNNEQYIDDDCGFHIHVSRNAFEKGTLLRLVHIVSTFKKDIETFARRQENTDYAKYLEFEPDFLWFKNKQSLKDYNKTRYQAINFENKNTIEFRMFKGTLDITEIYATIEFVNNLVNLTNDKTKTIICFEELLKGKNIKKYLNNNNFNFENKTIDFDKEGIFNGAKQIEEINNDYDDIVISLDVENKKLFITRKNAFDFVEINNKTLINHAFNKKAEKEKIDYSFNVSNLNEIIVNFINSFV